MLNILDMCNTEFNCGSHSCYWRATSGGYRLPILHTNIIKTSSVICESKCMEDIFREFVKFKSCSIHPGVRGFIPGFTWVRVVALLNDVAHEPIVQWLVSIDEHCKIFKFQARSIVFGKGCGQTYPDILKKGEWTILISLNFKSLPRFWWRWYL